MSTADTAESQVHGEVNPAFADVRAELLRNFRERGELGAACVVYHRGQKVVDLWGGYRDKERQKPWEQDTMVLVFSTTKGVAAMTIALAHARGLLDFDQPVAHYWPEFARHGKERITVRQLLSHQAGLSVIDKRLRPSILSDLDAVGAILADQRPIWEPGTRHGYHSATLGWYEGELIRRVDPKRRSLGQFFQEEIARPLDIEFYIGLPRDIPESQLAAIDDPHMIETLFNLDKTPWQMVKGLLVPWSLTARSLFLPGMRRARDLGSPIFRHSEVPACNGIGQVRAIAKAYSVLSTGGNELGLRPETLEALTAPAQPPTGGLLDQVLRINTCFSLGYLKPFPDFRFGSSQRCFGTPGFGGSFGFADPDAQIGFAYAPNRCGFYIFDDPRERALRSAVYACLAKLGAPA